MKMKDFNVGIKGVIIKDNKVLIMKTPIGTEQFWEMPGGRMDGNETVQETLTRELKEEVPNIQNIKIGGILGAYRVPHDIWPNTGLFLVFYSVRADFDGDPQISEEHSEWEWATKEEALATVHKNCHEAIHNAFKKTV